MRTVLQIILQFVCVSQFVQIRMHEYVPKVYARVRVRPCQRKIEDMSNSYDIHLSNPAVRCARVQQFVRVSNETYRYVLLNSFLAVLFFISIERLVLYT